MSFPCPACRLQDGVVVPANDGPRWAGMAEPGSPLAQGLDQVAAADPSFDAKVFLAGARGAYEMIVHGLRAGRPQDTVGPAGPRCV